MPTIMLDPNNPLHLIPATLASNPGAVAVIPVFAPAYPDTTLVIQVSRKTRTIPPRLRELMVGSNGEEPPSRVEVGRVLLTIPSDMATNLQGPPELRHPLYLFSVHRAVYDEAIRQANSGLVLPSVGGVGGSGGRLVVP